MKFLVENGNMFSIKIMIRLNLIEKLYGKL